MHRAHVFHRDSSSGNLAHPLSASTRWQRRKLPLMKIPETQHNSNKVYTICNCPAGNQTARNNGMQQTPMLHFRYGRWDVIIIIIIIAWECGLLPQRNEHRIRSPCSRCLTFCLVFTPAALCWWA